VESRCAPLCDGLRPGVYCTHVYYACIYVYFICVYGWYICIDENVY
jgi:hypothetical protein